MAIKKQLLIYFILFSSILSAQKPDSIRYPNIKVDGTMKNKFEYAFETQKMRFSVRNSRVGVSGDLTNFVSYRGQLELSDNGHFKVLDLYGTIKPIKGLKLSLGQVKVPLFNDYITTPSSMMFANRAFIGKYFLSTRDLGLDAHYQFKIATVPVSAEFGIYNGNTINDPIWSGEPSYGGRIEIGGMTGLRSTIKIYDYTNNSEDEKLKQIFYGADLRYATGRWKFETEIMSRKNKDDASDELLSYYVQCAHVIPLNEKWIFKNIIPAARWDAIDQKGPEKGFDINRLTFGIGFGFTQKYFSSLLRFDYENYFVNRKLDILNLYPEMDSDKFTVELLLTF